MNKFALLIGVNDYNYLTPLRFAVQDAECTAEALKKNYGFLNDEICLMTDSGRQRLYPDADNILSQINFLLKRPELDLLLVGFWGHSFAPKAGERYLCGIQTKEEDLIRTAVSLQQLIAGIRQVQALNTCLILDCCQCRANARGDDQAFDGRVAIGRDIVMSVPPTTSKSRRRRPTMAVLNACDDQQKAYEWEAMGHGLFTKFLLDGLNRRYASLSQLASYVTESVADTAERVLCKTQNPYIEIFGAGDIPLLPVSVASPGPGVSMTLEELKEEFYRRFLAEEALREEARRLALAQIEAEKQTKADTLSSQPTMPLATDEKGMVEEFERGLKVAQEFLEEFSITAPRVVRMLAFLRTVCARLVRVREDNLALWNCEFEVNQKEGMREDRSQMVELKGKIDRYDTFLKGFPRQDATLDEMVEFVQMKLAGDRMVKTVDGVNYAFRWCPPGSFQMGGELHFCHAKPIHTVNLSQGFWMLETEVTQRMWQSVTGFNPSKFKGNKLPVENVSWNDCQNFCRALCEKGLKVSLPTEAQWEYACRAGSTGDYAGNLDEMAWYSSNSGLRTHEVGLKQPNAWGLHDMHGNVWEWCQDWYDSGYYAKSPADDPTGARTGSFRVLRGGSWDFDAEYCRSARRGDYSPGSRYYGLGFRIILR